MKHLFSPIEISGNRLRNRITFTSIGIDSYNEEGTVTDENIWFVRARSKETAMIITTVSMATYRYGKVKFIGSYDDKFIPSLSRFAEAGHQGGAKIILQISAMGGPNTLADDVFHDIVPYVPTSGIPMYQEEWTGKNIPTELKTSQIKEIIDDFINASIRAKKAGFDGVELFAAEDFLLASFLTPHLNRRDDGYGGDFEGRLRMPVEIIEGIKKACGHDFIIGFKYNTYYEFPTGDGIDLDLGVRIGKRIRDAGASYLHEYSYAKHDKPFSLFRYSIMPSQYQPRNTTIPISERLKQEVGDIPIMAVGGILKPDEADRFIAEGKADLVSIGRAFIADHEWAYKARRGQDIRPCIRCFVCLDEATKSRIIACSVNPDVLVEEKKKIKKAPVSKKVMIIGSGPAGIVAALTSYKRGHKVLLFEKEQDIGGALIPASMPGIKYEYLDLLEYYRRELSRTSVDIKTGIEADTDIVKEIDPDVLIVAIGAAPLIPDITGIEEESVMGPIEAINKEDEIMDKKIVVLGGGDTGCEIALDLLKKRNDVTIVEQAEKILKENDIEYLTMVLEKKLIENGCRIITGLRILKISESRVLVEKKDKNIFELPADIIINAIGFVPKESEVKRLLSACKDSHAIGDCVKPGKIFQATTQAYELALKI